MIEQCFFLPADYVSTAQTAGDGQAKREERDHDRCNVTPKAAATHCDTRSQVRVRRS